MLLVDDNLHEADGAITLRLLDDSAPSPTYAVATPPAHEASVLIIDNDELPEISIAAVNPIVAEVQTAEFLLRATSAISSEKSRVKLSLGGSLNEFVDGDALFNQFKTIYINEVYNGDATQYNESTDDALVLANGLYVEFDGNATTARLTIPIDDDSMVEPDGRISLTILSGENYVVDSDANTASVLIRDNDIAALIIAGGRAITEGGMANFTLSMNPPPQTPITVNVFLAQTGGNFITVDEDDDNPYSKQVEINPTTGIGTLAVATSDDAQDEHNGSVIATVLQDSNIPPRFRLGNPFTTSVTVNDNDPDLPRVSIALKSGQTTPITEGGNFVVELTANPAPQPDSPLAITLEVEETGSGTGYYNNFSPDPIEITDGNPVEVTISTHGDDIDEDHGEITVTVEGTADYLAAISPDNSIAVAINDDDPDLPAVSITSNALSILEGGVVPFEVSMVPPPAQGTTQTITLENTPSSDFFNQYLPNPLVINDSGSARGVILTNNNEIYERNSEMVVAVSGVANQYRPASAPNNALTITIRDDDLPEISVSDFVVLEGSTDTIYNLPISISPAPFEDVTILYSVGLTSEATAGNDFELVGNSPYSINLSSTQLTGQIPITIKSDSIDDPLETFVLVLTSTNAVFENGFTNYVVTGTITEKPIISISSRFNRVSDSDYFGYTVSAEPSLSSNLSIPLTVTDAAEDLIADADESPTAELTSVLQSVDKQLAFNTNTANNSLISIAIDPDSNYFVDSVKNSVSVRVDDGDDLPVVSITGNGEVNEGGIALYTVSVADATNQNGIIIPRRSNLFVNINTTETTTNYISDTPASVIAIAPNMNQVTYSVPTQRDSADGSNGTITAEILPGAGYKRGQPSTRSGQVSVLDDADFPIVTFSAIDNTAIEGTRINYPFTLTPASTGDVRLSFSGNSGTPAIFGVDYTIADTSTRIVANGDSAGTIFIDPIADQLYEGVDETFAITVTLTKAKFADNSNTITLTGTIRDGDSPHISIAPTSADSDCRRWSSSV